MDVSSLSIVVSSFHGAKKVSIIVVVVGERIVVEKVNVSCIPGVDPLLHHIKEDADVSSVVFSLVVHLAGSTH